MVRHRTGRERRKIGLAVESGFNSQETGGQQSASFSISGPLASQSDKITPALPQEADSRLFHRGQRLDYQKFDDETLIRLIARAQPEALSELYDRYSRMVFGMAVHIINDDAQAEEITQEVFLRAWEHAASYRADLGKVGSWLAGITRNRAIDLLRHRLTTSDGHSFSMDALPFFDLPGSQDIEKDAEESAQRLRVRQALAQLPKEQREALAMAYFNGYTQEEVAQALHEPLGTIKTRIRLGMQKLRQLLEDENTLFR
jgi:RNA polymerase sigma-70 factor, ECF subfamily